MPITVYWRTAAATQPASARTPAWTASRFAATTASPSPKRSPHTAPAPKPARTPAATPGGGAGWMRIGSILARSYPIALREASRDAVGSARALAHDVAGGRRETEIHAARGAVGFDVLFDGETLAFETEAPHERAPGSARAVAVRQPGAAQ